MIHSKKNKARSHEMISAFNKTGQFPIMVALSALITEDIKKRCLEVGFSITIESPLT